jgi:hypothetical protein
VERNAPPVTDGGVDSASWQLALRCPLGSRWAMSRWISTDDFARGRFEVKRPGFFETEDVQTRSVPGFRPASSNVPPPFESHSFRHVAGIGNLTIPQRSIDRVMDRLIARRRSRGEPDRAEVSKCGRITAQPQHNKNGRLLQIEIDLLCDAKSSNKATCGNSAAKMWCLFRAVWICASSLSRPVGISTNWQAAEWLPFWRFLGRTPKKYPAFSGPQVVCLRPQAVRCSTYGCVELT